MHLSPRYPTFLVSFIDILLAELMELYDVSKSTIVKALERLENRGLIYQVQGSGVFVRRPKRADYVNLIDNNGFTADLPTHKMASKVLTLRKIKPPKKFKLDLTLSRPRSMKYGVYAISMLMFCV